MTGLLATALERAQDFLLAPAPSATCDVAVDSASLPIAVAVVGLRRCSGASTVARGLGRALETRVPGAADLVWDLPPAELEQSPFERWRVDATVLVSPGDGEPALASIAAGLLRTRLGRVLVVANRVRDAGAWSGHATVCLPDSRLAAMLAARGHLPPGELGEALTRLAITLIDER